MALPTPSQVVPTPHGSPAAGPARPPIRQAMVMAAGLGERMRPLTNDRPKPLIPVGGRSMLDRALDRLEAAEVPVAVVNLHYLGGQIRVAQADRRRPEIRFSEEAERLETGGGILRALDRRLLADEPFFVINADSVWLDGPTPALARLAGRFDPAEMDALLLLHAAPRAPGYDGRGDFLMDPLGRLRRRPERGIAPYVYAGVQVTHPGLFAGEPERRVSLNPFWDRAIAAGRLFGIVHDGWWFHIGSPRELAEADPLLDPRAARWLEW